MPILYSTVVCDKNIVVNFASCDGNFKEIIEQVISKVPKRDHKMTYAHGPYLFHYIFQDKYLYFCITDKMCQRSRAFLFLNEIQRRFNVEGKYDFLEVLAKEMYRYSEDYNTITVRKGELDEINFIGVDSSENILGEKILYVNNPDNISYSTLSYVGTTPERISISVTVPDIRNENLDTFVSSNGLGDDIPNTKLYNIIYIGICIVIISLLIFIFGPVSSVIFVFLIAFYLISLRKPAKNKDD